MSAPPLGQVDVSTVWFAVPMRLVNKKFQKFITGYYQDTSGSSQFLKRPNMMFNFSEDRQSDVLVKFFDPDQYGRYSLLNYCGIRTASPGTYPRKTRIECARVLAFWYVYFEYFVDQNIGYRPAPIFSELLSQIDLRTEDGSVLKTSSILNWEQFTQIILTPSTQFPAVGGYLTIGDCIEHGVDIPIDTLPYSTLIWLCALPDKCWPKDYFTSALPWAQKGDPVGVPISLTNVTGTLLGDVSVSTADTPGGSSTQSRLGTAVNGTKSPIHAFSTGNSDLGNATLHGSITSGIAAFMDKNSAGNDNRASMLINDLRAAYAMQAFLEKNARCGSRYVEQILSHFGVRTSDARLNRPEYLGGFKVPVHVSSTAQTSEDGTTPQGNLAGQGVAAGSGKNITFFSEEHTILICMNYVQPRAIYYQGLSRLLTRNEFYDFFFPEFAHLGEQEIKCKELYYDPNDRPYSDGTFGYQSRYSEYKFMNNELNGDFLHESLRSWMFGVRQFSNQPRLSPEFLQVNPEVETSLKSNFPALSNAAEDAFDKLYCQIDFDIKALRPMPKYGTPYM